MLYDKNTEAHAEARWWVMMTNLSEAFTSLPYQGGWMDQPFKSVLISLIVLNYKAEKQEAERAKQRRESEKRAAGNKGRTPHRSR